MKNKILKDIREDEERREFLDSAEIEGPCIDYDEFDEDGNLISPPLSADIAPEDEYFRNESEYA